MGFWKQFQGRSLPVVAHMLSQTRKGGCLVVEQLFDVYNIHVQHNIIIFELCMSEKKKGRRLTKLEFLHLVFSHFEKG